jgi:hypothetical protein
MRSEDNVGLGGNPEVELDGLARVEITEINKNSALKNKLIIVPLPGHRWLQGAGLTAQ